MKRKSLPLIVMLTAGAITSIVTYFANVTMDRKVIALSVVLVLFYFLGYVLKMMLDKFDKQNEEGELADTVFEMDSNQNDSQEENR